MNSILILILAIFGASAAPSCPTGSYASTLSGRTICSQTPVIENPTTLFPSCIPPASVSQSCHCLKTIVRPQIRNEIITVPSIDRIVRYVPSPVVEAVSVNCDGYTRNLRNSIYGASGISGGFVNGIINSGIVENAGCGGVLNSGTIGNGCGFVGVSNSGCGVVV